MPTSTEHSDHCNNLLPWHFDSVIFTTVTLGPGGSSGLFGGGWTKCHFLYFSCSIDPWIGCGLSFPNLALGTVSHNQQNSTNPWVVGLLEFVDCNWPYPRLQKVRLGLMPNLRGTAASVLRGTGRIVFALTRYSCPSRYNTCEVRLYLRSTATPTRYSCTYKVQLDIRDTDAPARYSSTFELQLHLQGTASPTRYSCTYDVQLHPQGTAALQGTGSL
jgi:hypothetical protein